MIVEWILVLHMLHNGEKLEYNDTYTSAAACVSARTVALDKILKENPQIKGDGSDVFVLVCEPKYKKGD